MPESPMHASPYEVLGVASTATHDELRAAYRRMLRVTHPDTGGDAVRFDAVQKAWERVATPELRAAYDRGAPAPRAEQHTWAPAAPRRAADTRPGTRAYGHPGGWRRERYLALIREWAGVGVDVPDPYDAALVRGAPREVRRLLADALAEEATARGIAQLGIGFTVWHDVAIGQPDEKLDHVVLGPTGLFALMSEDWGGPVRVRRGELIGEALDGAEPVRDLVRRAKALTRITRVKFTGLLVVVPDDAVESVFESLGRHRGAEAAVVRASFLPALLRSGMPNAPSIGGTDLFDLRTRLQQTIRFAE